MSDTDNIECEDCKDYRYQISVLERAIEAVIKLSNKDHMQLAEIRKVLQE